MRGLVCASDGDIGLVNVEGSCANDVAPISACVACSRPISREGALVESLEGEGPSEVTVSALSCSWHASSPHSSSELETKSAIGADMSWSTTVILRVLGFHQWVGYFLATLLTTMATTIMKAMPSATGQRVYQ